MCHLLEYAVRHFAGFGQIQSDHSQLLLGLVRLLLHRKRKTEFNSLGFVRQVQGLSAKLLAVFICQTKVLLGTTEYAEWQRPLSGVHFIMMKKIRRGW